MLVLIIDSLEEHVRKAVHQVLQKIERTGQFSAIISIADKSTAPYSELIPARSHPRQTLSPELRQDDQRGTRLQQQWPASSDQVLHTAGKFRSQSS